MKDLNDKISTIKLLILDVDGVLTDGKIWVNHLGEEHKNFHVHDGMGIKNLMERGIVVAVISSRSSKVVSFRMQELGIEHFYQGEENKITAYQQLLALLNIMESEVGYVGDDLPDLAIMQRVGFPIAVANAVPQILRIAAWITEKKGGEGAVREVCDLILQNLSDNTRSATEILTPHHETNR